MVSISFHENQTDWMSREIALKLMDQKYKIVNAPRFDEKINIIPVEIKPVRNEDISTITFNRDDTNLKAIVDHYKIMVDEGDMLFSKNEYKDAPLKYQEIITSIDMKLTNESRKKLKHFIDSVNKRISSALVMEYKTSIEEIDKLILPEKNPERYGKSFR